MFVADNNRPKTHAHELVEIRYQFDELPPSTRWLKVCAVTQMANKTDARTHNTLTRGPFCRAASGRGAHRSTADAQTPETTMTAPTTTTTRANVNMGARAP